MVDLATKSLLLGLLALVVLKAHAAGHCAAQYRGSTTSAPAPTGSRDRVAAKGRVVAYPGAEMVIGTDLAETIVILQTQEKDRVRRGHSPVAPTTTGLPWPGPRARGID
jgi:hypothetical protein